MTTETTVTIIGWLGFIFCTVAYLLLNVKVLRFDGALYQTLNVIGGLGLVISAFYFADTPNLAANGMWVLIGLFGLARYSRRGGRSGRSNRVTDT